MAHIVRKIPGHLTAFVAPETVSYGSFVRKIAHIVRKILGHLIAVAAPETVVSLVKFNQERRDASAAEPAEHQQSCCTGQFYI
jgi:hypothetical protein